MAPLGFFKGGPMPPLEFAKGGPMPPLGFSKGGPMPPLEFFKGGQNFLKGGQCPPLGGAVYHPDQVSCRWWEAWWLVPVVVLAIITEQ